ncbi:mitochondrial intermembrane space import and assembly protein 40 [Geosmithia morbida]|uniref:Mitochondrial intermembrane space import and assembly protein 40 n=1 Tax=Geosmithia morbida TaxID=1094350 RepID=A0A9P5D2V7_9HYPO|nr:mitochondrial intermembrane space import and assembly protein 40 [Geosmithia morbida]KAF4125508.1 mitochondrial intermembrane space import and assembly protein 40 [Geosmithia morbida]
MFRTTFRAASRSTALRSLRAQQPASSFRRFASTSSSPANKPRTWKGSVLRWGLAGGILYYYSTSNVFADDAASQTIAPPPSFTDSDLPTVDSLLEEKRKLVKETSEKAAPKPAAETKQKQLPPAEAPKTETPGIEGSGDVAAAAGVQALEGEADQQGAFNPETGEINWDCPCLGGMAHGPCGEDFKTAFSCFVYSEADPKGMDCIEKFQGMQDCFRKYPDIYGGELTDDDGSSDAPAPAPASDAPIALASDASTAPATTTEAKPEAAFQAPAAKPETPEVRLDATPVGGSADGKKHSATPIKEGKPKMWVDATAANEDKNRINQ